MRQENIVCHIKGLRPIVQTRKAAIEAGISGNSFRAGGDIFRTEKIWGLKSKKCLCCPRHNLKKDSRNLKKNENKL